MGYLLYSTVFALLVLSTGMLPIPPLSLPSLHFASLTSVSTVLFLTRPIWTPLMPSLSISLPSGLLSSIPSPSFPSSFPGSSYLYSRLPSSFSSDIESGFSSSAFDLSANVAAGDSRAGLDTDSKREIQRIMKNRRVNFDEARRIYTEGRFAKNGIGPDGRPRDPKFVSFS
jgi:hypothetical protein